MNSNPVSPDNPSGQPQVVSQPQQPVAYDANGQPLYAQPVQPASTTPVVTTVHVARPAEPEAPAISLETQRLNERSRRLYPQLNLSDGEYVIRAVRRHPIGIIGPLASGTIVIALVLSVLVNYGSLVEKVGITGSVAEPGFLAIPVLVFAILVGLGMAIFYYVYAQNKFYLTNESVIQEIQNSLFSRQEQTVSLGNIEDASFTQKGIFQQLFNYGDIRLSTEGDETTYRFSYVSRPKEHIARLNNAVEAFKNGRPVTGD